MKTTFAFALLFAVAACSQAPPASERTTASATVRTVNEVAISSGTPVTTADLSISGMTCEMGCGGTIKSALAQLQGVSKADIKFIEGDTPDHAIVTYDASKLDDAELVKTVEALNHGQYKVLAVNITKEVVKAGTADQPAKSDDANGKVNAAAIENVVVPSLIALLSHLVRV